MEKLEVSWGDIRTKANHTCSLLIGQFFNGKPLTEEQYKKHTPITAYPIPTGGIFAAQAVVAAAAACRITVRLTENPYDADIYIDDLVDSGDTRNQIFKQYGRKPFYAFYFKKEENIKQWIRFPWERESDEFGPETNIRRIIEYIGDDSSREGLIETPRRVAKSYQHLFSGYNQDPEHLFKIFEDGACDEMVVLRGIEFWSFCEHHMLPFFGRAHIAYIPNGKVIGVSKLARILECFSRRLQIQERLTEQITDALDKHLQPKGSACVLEAKHLCMVMRGVQKQQADMITSSLTGAFRENSNVRSEFFSLIK